MIIFLTTEDDEFLTTEDGAFLIMDGIVAADVRKAFIALARTIEFTAVARTADFTVVARTTDFTLTTGS